MNMYIFRPQTFQINVYSTFQTFQFTTDQSKTLLLLITANFGLFLVDHIHFQYNGVIIGISLLFLSYLANGSIFAAASIFTIMLNMKVWFQ